MHELSQTQDGSNNTNPDNSRSQFFTMRKSLESAIQSTMLAKDLKHDKSMINNFYTNTDEFKSQPIYLSSLDDLEFFYFLRDLKARYAKEKKKLKKMLKYQYEKNAIHERSRTGRRPFYFDLPKTQLK